jgi:hypothetical protein
MFAEVCPLNVIPASIAKRDPPAPDLLCVVADNEEQVGFELVEIIDEGWASLTSGQFRETRSLRGAYLASSGDYRHALDERIANALVYVSFLADVQARRRRSAVPEILRHLSTIRPDFCGEWKPPVGTPLHGTVRAIRISRGAFPGPEFDVEAVRAIGDPTLDRVRAKWRKSYASPHPIELLAYYELQPQAPEALWLPALESFVRDNSDASPFRRVWVFDVGSRSISCSFACPKSTGRLTAHAPGGAART